MNEQGLRSEDIINTVRYGKDLPILELKYEKGNSKVSEIEDRKQTLLCEVQDLEGNIEVSKNVITSIEQKRKEVKSLQYEKQKL